MMRFCVLIDRIRYLVLSRISQYQILEMFCWCFARTFGTYYKWLIIRHKQGGVLALLGPLKTLHHRSTTEDIILRTEKDGWSQHN